MVAPTVMLARHAVEAGGPGRIGPNAILQIVPVLDRALGRDGRDRLLSEAGVSDLPDGHGLIDEGPVARLHQTLRLRYPDLAPDLARQAGEATADYIIANRIPRPVRALLRLLPVRLAAPVLSRAIARNAWTFAGSGRFGLVSVRPPVFEIADNPVVRGETAHVPVCVWHAAVFERLFGNLVTPSAQVTETACCATGAPACRFEVRLSA